MFLSSLVLQVALLTSAFVDAAPNAVDPCINVAGKTFVPPSDALACLKSFPFNETLRQNVLATVSGVFDFFTFEDYYLKSPPPFQESTVDIRAELQRIKTANYATDYDFNRDLYDFVTRLNDGHTRWFPACYWTVWQNLLPTPPVNIEMNGVQGVFVAPDAVEFVNQLGPDFTDFYDSINFDWQRLAGAQILKINGISAYDYVDRIAFNTSGNYLDHGVRVNSVFSSYRIDSTNAFSQRIGDLAGPPFPDQDSITLTLVPQGSRKAETVTVPYLASFLGAATFTDGPSFWQNFCVANEDTNGVDFSQSTSGLVPEIAPHRRLMKGDIVDGSLKQAVGLPQQFQPTVPIIAGQNGTVKSFILPDNITGVLFLGSFGGDEGQFQSDTVTAVNVFKQRGVQRLILDVTNNGGGFVCLGQWLHQFLAGSNKIKLPGFQSTMRGNPLAQKIVASDIARNITAFEAFYSPENWEFLNGTQQLLDFNYITPTVSVKINGENQPTSQRFLDTCNIDGEFIEPIPTEAPFDLRKVVIVGNGNCASTCAMFTTLMHERLGTKNIVFGGKPKEKLQFKGMAGNQVLEWFDLDSEIKTGHVKDDPLAPPDLLVNANMRVNWRTAYSFFDESTPIAYKSELADIQFAYTNVTYNNPQKLWEFVAENVL